MPFIIVQERPSVSTTTLTFMPHVCHTEQGAMVGESHENHTATDRLHGENAKASARPNEMD